MDIVDKLKTRFDPRIVFPDDVAREAVGEIERLRRQAGACWRYFDHCRRVSLSARHAGCDSAEMAVRMSLKQDAETALGMSGDIAAVE